MSQLYWLKQHSSLLSLVGWKKPTWLGIITGIINVQEVGGWRRIWTHEMQMFRPTMESRLSHVECIVLWRYRRVRCLFSSRTWQRGDEGIRHTGSRTRVGSGNSPARRG